MLHDLRVGTTLKLFWAGTLFCISIRYHYCTASSYGEKYSNRDTKTGVRIQKSKHWNDDSNNSHTAKAHLHQRHLLSRNGSFRLASYSSYSRVFQRASRNVRHETEWHNMPRTWQNIRWHLKMNGMLGTAYEHQRAYRRPPSPWPSEAELIILWNDIHPTLPPNHTVQADGPEGAWICHVLFPAPHYPPL